jgi:RNA polymerase sigma factor (sigma-70 family)
MMSEVDAQIDGRELSDADLYARHAGELVRFATVLVGPCGADDLVAEAVARVVAHPSWPTVQERRAYLYRAVLNEARHQERARFRRRRREELAAERERVDALDVRPEVLAAVRSLAPRQRAVVFFTYWQDRTTSDIAAELGITPRTVQRELAKARLKLEDALR